MKRAQWLLGLGFVVAVSASLYGASVLTAYLAPKLRWPFLTPVLNVAGPLLALFTVGLLGNLLGRLFPIPSPFDALNGVIQRIASGDFSTRLDEAENPQLRNLAASVNQMAAALGQMERMRQEFISNVSHEIQSPLTSIRGFAQALRSETLSPGQRSDYLEIIEVEAVRLSHLSENLLMLAALEPAGDALEKADYRLDRQIRAVILTAEPQWQARAIQWDLRLAPVTITAHGELLSQVWLNLVQNAIKFSHPGGVIEVEGAVHAGQAVVRVIDHGIGIAPEDQLRIFERFYKADKARDRAMGGNGLGLAIARKIVTLHGGMVTVQSQIDTGTTFTVTLPTGAVAV